MRGHSHSPVRASHAQGAANSLPGCGQRLGHEQAAGGANGEVALASRPDEVRPPGRGAVTRVVPLLSAATRALGWRATREGRRPTGTGWASGAPVARLVSGARQRLPRAGCNGLVPGVRRPMEGGPHRRRMRGGCRRRGVCRPSPRGSGVPALRPPRATCHLMWSPCRGRRPDHWRDGRTARWGPATGR
jgi:hypothetical protein